MHLDWGRERRWCYPRDGKCWTPETMPIRASRDWIVLHGVRTFTSPTGTAAIERGGEVTVRVGAITWFREMVDWPGHTRLVAGDLGMDIWESPDVMIPGRRTPAKAPFVAVGMEREESVCTAKAMDGLTVDEVQEYLRRRIKAAEFDRWQAGPAAKEGPKT